MRKGKPTVLKLMTLTEAAKMLGISPRTVWLYVLKGKISSIRSGKQVRVLAASIKELSKRKPRHRVAERDLTTHRILQRKL